MARTRRLVCPLALASFLVVLHAGCSQSAPGEVFPGVGDVDGRGVVTIRVHDEAEPALDEFHVTFSLLAVREVGGGWILLEPTGGDVDLLAHVGPDNAVTVTTGLVPAGDYDRVRATIAAARVLLSDGTPRDVPLPPDGYPVEAPVPFTVSEEGEVIVDLHFPVEGSVRIVGTDVVYAPTVEANVASTD